MSRRERAARPLRRTTGTLSPRRTVVVYCEGELTEPQYLRALRRQPEVRDVSAVDIRIEESTFGSDPLTLVKAALAAKLKADQEEGEIDSFWCVFDVEWPVNHPGLRQAVEIAARGGIQLAISNPCFELWLALHFAEHQAWLDNNQAQRLRHSHDRAVGKGLDAARYMPVRKIATQRAERLERRHLKDGTDFPHDNPSSGMHRFVTFVESPQPSAG